VRRHSRSSGTPEGTTERAKAWGGAVEREEQSKKIPLLSSLGFVGLIAWSWIGFPIVCLGVFSPSICRRIAKCDVALLRVWRLEHCVLGMSQKSLRD